VLFRSPLECNGFGSFIYDPEEMKLLLENLCRDSGVNVLLHTRATDAEVNAGTLTAVVAANHAGNQVYSAKTFLDCTGNGDLAAYAGCSYEAGHPENGKLQPTSLHALVTGVPENFKNTLQNRKRKIAFRDLLLSVGVEPSYQKPVLFKLVHGDIWAFCVTHMYGVRYDSPENVTNATIEGRKQIHDAVNALRTLPEWKNLRVVATSDLLGIREGRRIKGLYSVTTDDLEKGKKHEDGIGNVSFGVDVHALDSSNKGGFLVTSIKTKTYHIPFRSLISSEIGNLGMAGRCISGDFFAHSSYRQIGIAAAMGEAAGYAAAAARKDGITLSELDGTRVAGYMKRQGYVL
jgi:hypothetical protein